MYALSMFQFIRLFRQMNNIYLVFHLGIFDDKCTDVIATEKFFDSEILPILTR